MTEVNLLDLQRQLEAERAAHIQSIALLHDYEERLRLFSMTSDDPTWDWNILTGEVDRNYAAAVFFGDNSPLENSTMEWWQDRIHPEDRARVLSLFAQAIAGAHSTFSVEYRFCKADHSIAYIYDRASIMRNAEGVAVRMVAIMIDLSTLVAAQGSLAKTEAALIHASRYNAMGTMASMIAHELNQPLAAIANYIRAGRHIASRSNEPADADFDEALRAAEENALRAGGIVHRLRDLVRPGHAEHRSEAVASIIDDACAIALIDAEILGVHYEVDIAPEIPRVMVDPIQIQQVLINLIRNSVDAFEDRSNRKIRIAARVDGDFVEVSVTDNGPGIDPEIAEDLFTARTSLKVSGMGIGLSICRTIVEADGGAIWLADSEVGASFRFTLPVAS